MLINSDYPAFMDWLYSRNAGLSKMSFDRQIEIRCESCFGVTQFYKIELENLGHKVFLVYANNEKAQRRWADENGIIARGNSRWSFRLRKGLLPWFSRSSDLHWMYEILEAQAKNFEPDIIINQIMYLDYAFTNRMKERGIRLIGQHQAPLPDDNDLLPYDLILSSLPNQIEYFRKLGVRSEYFPLAFEPSVLEKISYPLERDIPVSFVGSLSRYHLSRIEFLKSICRETEISVFGEADPDIIHGTELENCVMPPCWGLDMYRILARSKITLNHHIDVAGDYANNLRLYEATGTGALLITDWKKNLHEIFKPGREVLAFRTLAECVELIRKYLENDKERETIALTAQKKTLEKYSYSERIRKLMEIINTL
jgi:hypothetical protein